MSNCIAIDCEMVGGLRGENMAARVSLVNESGQLVMDEYINPGRNVADYRTHVSGITPAHLQRADSLSTVQAKVQRAINGKILVGHSLDADLGALGLDHPQSQRRDLAQHPQFRKLNGGQPPSLQLLAETYLGRRIQQGQHSSVEDAKTCMDIYIRHWQ